jgi:hypothetical protein
MSKNLFIIIVNGLYDSTTKREVFCYTLTRSYSKDVQDIAILKRIRCLSFLQLPLNLDDTPDGGFWFSFFGFCY